MPYIERDGSNAVCGCTMFARMKDQEYLPDTDPEVVAFFAKVFPVDKPQRDIIRSEAILQTLFNATPQQIDTYFTNNVTNLAQAISVLKVLAKAISVLGKQI